MFGADGVVAPESSNPSQAEGMEERSFIFSTGNETVCQGDLCLLTRGGLIRVISSKVIRFFLILF